MNNIKLLQYCIRHPEKFLDYNYMFVKKDPNLNCYRERTIEIKELLITIKNIKNKQKSQNTLNQLFIELQQKLKKHANYSEFGSFINACDSTVEESINNMGLLKKITYLHLEKRKVSDITPTEWIQAIIDKGSSRKKGQAGENKLIKILEKKGFVKTKEIKEFVNQNRCVAKFSKRGEFSNTNIKKTFNILIGKKTQGKSLDLIIKKNKDIFFLEAKHLNTGGGEQNKQVLELIEIVNIKPTGKNYHFVAFLDGIHSNNIFNIGRQLRNKIRQKKESRKTKEQIQYEDIKKALTKNENNYWINTAGFLKLFS
jgi:hypothetical protein